MSKSGYKIQKKYSRTRTFGAEVHKSNIRVTRWHNKYKILNYILICLPSPIVLHYSPIKKRKELLGHPLYGFQLPFLQIVTPRYLRDCTCATCVPFICKSKLLNNESMVLLPASISLVFFTFMASLFSYGMSH